MHQKKFNSWILYVGFILMLGVFLFTWVTAVSTDWYYYLDGNLKQFLRIAILTYCVGYTIAVPFLMYARDRKSLRSQAMSKEREYETSEDYSIKQNDVAFVGVSVIDRNSGVKEDGADL